MTQPVQLNYSQITSWRAECHRRFGSVINLPVVVSPYEIIRPYSRQGFVLDVGSGSEKILRKILNIPDQRYFSLDSDPQVDGSFVSFDEIPAEMKFELVVMNQVLEHLTIEESYDFLRQCKSLLEEEGYLIVSVPNAAHPVRFHADVWHRTNWPFNDLYGLARTAGYEVVALFRANKRPQSGNPITRWLVNVVCREFRIDWCDTIILVGKRIDVAG